VGHVGLGCPVPRRLDLARRIDRRAPADVDPVADFHRAGVAARFLSRRLGLGLFASMPAE
jgi:hypothetical protein